MKMRQRLPKDVAFLRYVMEPLKYALAVVVVELLSSEKARDTRE